jgi:glutamate---cysteine ligase / carboxylate-amine ligase
MDRTEPTHAEGEYLVYSYNRFQACRFGLDGTIVHPKTHETLSLREDILTTLRRMEPYAEMMDGLPSLEHLYQIAREGSDASYLRQQYIERGGTEGMVDSAIRRFQDGCR